MVTAVTWLHTEHVEIGRSEYVSMEIADVALDDHEVRGP